MAFIRVFLAVIIIIMSTCAVNAGPDPDWHISFGVSINDSLPISSSFGTKPDAIDWVGPEDCLPDGMLAIVYDDTKNAFAYTLVNGKVLTYDYRSPIEDTAKVWNIWLTATEPGTIDLMAYSLSLNPYYNGKFPPNVEPGHPIFVGDYDGGLQSLTLWHGAEKLWDWQPGQTMAPMKSFAYDGSAIALRLVATPMSTPEPCSVIAILSGLCGLFGLALEYRRSNSC